MDPEEKKIDQDEVDSELKKALSDELSSYMNPHSTPVVPEQKVIPPEIVTTNVLSPKIAPIQVEIKEKPKTIIRTFKGDMEETIQANHVSSINIALAENKKMMERMRSAETEKITIKKNYTVLIVSFLLVAGGILAFAIPYFLVNKQYAQEEVSESLSSVTFITAESEEKINLDSVVLDRISSTLSERIDQSNIRLGSIKNIFLTEGSGTAEETINTQKFISLMKFNLPKEIERTLRPEYMFGMHSFNGNQKFLILKVGSYENAFAGMLKWEIDLWSDFKNLFSLSSISLPTNQTGRIPGIETPAFQDAVYANKDTRVVKDSSGGVLFLYSIIDKNTVVFTTSTDTLKEIINRNIKSKAVAQ
ncbi:MAG: hypothetical protein WC229_00905 [Candidatus Paceibacterota bacterium]|jgi:hypothetical protein